MTNSALEEKNCRSYLCLILWEVNMKLVRSLKSLSALILSLAVVSCGTGPGKLVGKWQAPDGEKIEFFEKGDFYLTLAPPGPYQMRARGGLGGTYEVIGDGRLKLMIAGAFTVHEFAVDHDSLTIRDVHNDGKATAYKRTP